MESIFNQLVPLGTFKRWENWLGDMFNWKAETALEKFEPFDVKCENGVYSFTIALPKKTIDNDQLSVKYEEEGILVVYKSLSQCLSYFRTLPKDSDPSTLECDLEDGELTITVKRLETRKPGD